MCGIAGFVRLRGDDRIDPAVLRSMTACLAHRGPDGEGYHEQGGLGLGHRRLAVIDLPGGDQPMILHGGALALVFNGEIYNYVELRERLAAQGRVFRTESDTEVLLQAYDAWGPGCVDELNGMWAFALWDAPRRRLFCSRDRLGEKPLYHAVHGDHFVFGSEAKALFRFGVPRELDPSMLDAYLCLGYVPAPHTMFQGVAKLQAGHSLLVESGQVRVRRYWDVQYEPDDRARTDVPAILEEFETLFDESVRLRMRSDVPLGAFLSGGLDSASIVASMAGQSGEAVRTCTIGFDDPETDERGPARRVAEAFHTDHVERLVTAADAASTMERLAWHYDEPFGDTSSLPTFLVSQVARERVTVALTGDGGDEVLSGYTIHRGEKFSERFRRLPSVARTRLIPGGLRLVRSLTGSATRERLSRAARVVASANLDFVDRLESKQTGFTREERRALIGHLSHVRPAREFIEEGLAPVADRDDLTRLNYWMLKVSLPDNMMCKVDRASMAHGLETRMPLLDPRLVELLARVAMSVKLPGYDAKYVLKRSVGRRLPRALLKAPKRGFCLPLSAWLHADTESAIVARARRSAEAGFVRGGLIDELLARHRAGWGDAGTALWKLAMLSYVP